MAQRLDTMHAPNPPRLDDILRPSVFVARVEEVPLYGGARARRLARKRRVRRTTAAVLCLLLAAGAVFVLTQRNATTAVTLDEAVKAFRDDRVDAPAEAVPTGTEKTKGAERSSVATVAQTTDPKRSVEAAAPVETTPYVLPAEGVYAYRTKGNESISMFGASHTYPDEVFSTVRHIGDCRWEQRTRVIEEHTDIRTSCSATASLTQLAQERQVTFFGKRDGAKLDCTPALVLDRKGVKPGDAEKSFCTDGNGTNASLIAKLVGVEHMTIGEKGTEAVHVRITGEMSGRVAGASKDDLWVSPETGLTLRWDRTVDTLAKAFGNAKVRYREDASFLLESLDPRK